MNKNIFLSNFDVEIKVFFNSELVFSELFSDNDFLSLSDYDRITRKVLKRTCLRENLDFNLFSWDFVLHRNKKTSQ